MHIEDVLDVLVAEVRRAREAERAASLPARKAKWRLYEQAYIKAVTDIYGLGAALRIERRIAGREDDETA